MQIDPAPGPTSWSYCDCWGFKSHDLWCIDGASGKYRLAGLYRRVKYVAGYTNANSTPTRDLTAKCNAGANSATPKQGDAGLGACVLLRMNFVTHESRRRRLMPALDCRN
jgi:hypothetical protein